jgi:nucleoside-diphosphate-sugar epimerase
MGHPKRIVLSGPSGFVGSRVLDVLLTVVLDCDRYVCCLTLLLQVHEYRMENGLPPGEITLLSSSPGTLMGRLVSKYGPSVMQTVRASRVDYCKYPQPLCQDEHRSASYVRPSLHLNTDTQHNADEWRDHLGSLGLGGKDSVFVNLAAVAGPVKGKPDALMNVNYRSVIAAAEACQQLHFGHWLQSSTQATATERAGQVPYSRGKMMADFALSQMHGLPVSIACIGVVYCTKTGSVGQSTGFNLVDLARLPLTPILGTGTAPVQPQEVQ